jgi:hypothetical protein
MSRIIQASELTIGMAAWLEDDHKWADVVVVEKMSNGIILRVGFADNLTGWRPYSYQEPVIIKERKVQVPVSALRITDKIWLADWYGAGVALTRLERASASTIEIWYADNPYTNCEFDLRSKDEIVTISER